MRKLQPYVYHKSKEQKPRAKPASGRIAPRAEQEQLSGMVQGKKASDIEERFARALEGNKRIEGYSFLQHYFGPTRTTPGAVEVDFMVQAGGEWYPVQIDGEYAHKTQQQRDKDAQKDQILNKYFGKFGNIKNVMRIPDATTMHAGILDAQESADQLVKRIW